MFHLLNANPRTMWILVCAGLAVLALALLVLGRLRWIQSRPIATCVVLSVFAHLLLTVSAYMTNLIQQPPLPPGPEGIRVSISLDDAPNPYPSEDQLEDPPWQRLASSLPDLPVPAALSQPDTAPPSRSDTQPVVEQVPELSGGIPTEVVAVEEPLHPEAPDVAPMPHAPIEVTAEPSNPDRGEPGDESMVREGSESEPAAADGSRKALSPSEPPQPGHTSVGGTPRAVDPANTTGDAPAISDVTDHMPAHEVLQQEYGQLADLPSARGPEDSPSGGSDRSDANNHRWQSSSADPGPGNAGRPPRTAKEMPDALIARSPYPLPSGKRGNGPPVPFAVPTTRRLADGRPVPELYRLRVATDRLRWARQRGATRETEQAVADALTWLARGQSADGRWDARATGAGQERHVAGQDRASAGIRADTGITGLAILAFLGAGHTHLDGQHREVVQHGLEYLLRCQRADGNMAGPAQRFAMMYCHGIATLALGEGLAMTGDPRLVPYVRRAVGYTLSAQDRTTGGWRYGPHEPGDTSQFGWQLMALFSAQQGGLEVPDTTRVGMQRFLGSVSSGRFGGLASYRPLERGRASRSMTAEALVCRLFLAGGREDGAVREAADFVLAQPPGSAGRANLYYWYYATLGLSQLDETRWRMWNQALRTQLLARQQTSGPDAGSWPPDSVWGGHGGRVYSTALAALCLEVYYRYAPLKSIKTAAATAPRVDAAAERR